MYKDTLINWDFIHGGVMFIVDRVMVVVKFDWGITLSEWIDVDKVLKVIL